MSDLVVWCSVAIVYGVFYGFIACGTFLLPRDASLPFMFSMAVMGSGYTIIRNHGQDLWTIIFARIVTWCLCCYMMHLGALLRSKTGWRHAD